MFKFEKMIAWQKGLELVDRAYKLADAFPRPYESSFGDQLRRTTLSITNNLAEGSGRRTPANRRLYYDHAKGSV